MEAMNILDPLEAGKDGEFNEALEDIGGRDDTHEVERDRDIENLEARDRPCFEHLKTEVRKAWRVSDFEIDEVGEGEGCVCNVWEHSRR